MRVNIYLTQQQWPTKSGSCRGVGSEFFPTLGPLDGQPSLYPHISLLVPKYHGTPQRCLLEVAPSLGCPGQRAFWKHCTDLLSPWIFVGSCLTPCSPALRIISRRLGNFNRQSKACYLLSCLYFINLNRLTYMFNNHLHFLYCEFFVWFVHFFSINVLVLSKYMYFHLKSIYSHS